MGNLHLVTGYQGEAHITAADHGSLYAAIFGNGNYVLDRGNKLAASVITSNQVRIADGDIVLQGRHIRLNEGTHVDLTIENGAQGYKRNDLIVARYTRNAASGVEDASLVVIKGTASTTAASDPAYNNGDILTDHAETADFPLYRVPLDGITVGELVPLFDVAYLVTLGSDKKIRSENLPAMNYIPTSQKGVANGVAPLTAGKLLSDTYIPTIPVSKGGTGATSKQLACNNLSAKYIGTPGLVTTVEDLNELTTPGVYCGSVETTRNTPQYWSEWGGLEVEAWAAVSGGVCVKQTYRAVYTTFAGNVRTDHMVEYRRVCLYGKWSAWEQTDHIEL